MARRYMALQETRKRYYQKHKAERITYARERYRKMRDALREKQGR